jgi:hypothetical protein
MSTKARAKKESSADAEVKRLLADPEVLAEYNALDDPEDREDLLEALRVIDQTREEEYIPWEEVKNEIGL